MATFIPTITVNVSSISDAHQRLAAFRTLFNVQSEILPYIKGAFKAIDGELIFLTSHSALVDIKPNSIRWYDPQLKRSIKIIPVDDTFELILGT